MPTQIAKLDFLDYNIYKVADGYYSNPDIAGLVTKTSGGILELSATGGAHQVEVAASAAGVVETSYKRSDNKYVGARLINTKIRPTSVVGYGAINVQCGFELHYNHTVTIGNTTFAVGSAVTFTVNGVPYHIRWTQDTGLEIYASGVQSSWDNSPVSTNRPSGLKWIESKLRVFYSGDDLYIKYSGTHAGVNVLGYKVITNGAVSKTFSAILTESGSDYWAYGNMSLYTISSGEVPTYVTNIASSDMLPFQRYLPIIGGTLSSDSNASAWNGGLANLVDGDITSHSEPTTNGELLGFDSAISGTPSSLGLLMGRGVYFTPGAPTPLPTLGKIKSLQSSKFAVATTNTEDIKTHFGDGTLDSDLTIATTANPVGENLVATLFSGNEQFGNNNVPITTATILRTTIEVV